MSAFDDLVRTTLCLGVQEQEHWLPLGCGFLVSDRRLLWLVTSTRVLERAGDQPLTAWVSRDQDRVLLGLGTVLQQAGLTWLRSERGDVAACVFPMQPDWEVKAIPLLQAASTAQSQPLLQVHALAFPYGIEGFDPRDAFPLVLPGGLAGVDAGRERLYHTAPSLPLTEGAPLLLAVGADAQRQLLLAGVTNGPLRPAAPVPAKEIPATVAGLSMATPIAAVIQLLSSAAAREQSERVLARAAQTED
ncbi:MAG: hypothetical protein KDD82_25460 [Planctomycetes bacterium]|nr:hypothetical protein [Planctomycetota bacterium]